MMGQEPIDWASRLQIGQEFQTWDDLKDAIIECGVRTERVIISVKKDSKRHLVECKMNHTSVELERRCNMRLRAWLSKKTGIITITKSHLIHTCEAADHWKRRMHTKSNWLAGKIQEILVRNRTTRPSSLRDTCQALLHPDISYGNAYAAKVKALERLDGKEKESFYRIPDLCRHILERDPTATAKFSAPDGKFESLFILPGANKQAFKHCRPFVALDGTHTRSAYPQILLIAVGVDANDTVLHLAFCMVPTENPTEWRRFLRLLSEAMPELCVPGMVFVSDREKGLLDCVPELFPSGFHCFCAWHIGDNCR